jgi:RNA polymerase sigma-70 factor (ECF subfamily)
MPVSARQPTPATDAEAIWCEFHDGLLAFIDRRVRSRETSEDILQHVMLQIHRHAGEVRRHEAIGAWVYEIARNAIADHYRSAPVRREVAAGTVLEEEREPAPEPEPESDARRELAACCIAPLLQRLPQLHREALTMTEIEGLTQAEAAERAGVSLSGMKSRVQRGRGQLRRLLTDCCEIDLDRRRGVSGYRLRRDGCGCRPDLE